MFKIGPKKIGGYQPVFVIAEAGVNHNGSLDLAKKMVDVAVAAKADAVKFQSFKTKHLLIENIEKAPYQKLTTASEETQTDMIRRLEIDESFHREIKDYCDQRGIMFLSTPYDIDSLNLLMTLGVAAIKVASTDATNLLFLEQIAKAGVPVIMSTGMSSLSEIKLAFQRLRDGGCSDISLLKCTSNYPTAFEEVNLRGMVTLQTEFDAVIGFSDHTPGVGATPYAVALGAKIVEKHYTLDKQMEGPDHKASLDPDELKQWVQEIRRVELMLGRPELIPTESEAATKKSLQKNLVLNQNLTKGTRIEKSFIAAKRTGGIGISAIEIDAVIGKILAHDLSEDQPMEWSDLEDANEE